MVLKVDCQEPSTCHGQRWRIGKTLAGEYVMIQPLEERFLVFFCSTSSAKSTLDPAFDDRRTLDRNPKLTTQHGKGCPETRCKGSVET